MKFKDYLNSLVSRRKNSTSSTKSHKKSSNTKPHPDSTASADCHYDICGYDDIHNTVSDDQHSRTQILLTRHAELVNTIVGSRTSNENIVSSCTQCRLSIHHPKPFIPPPPTSVPPPLPPKLSLEQQISFSNRNYSSTLATCSPRRECQLPQHQICHPIPLISSQYSAPNPNVMSSSSSSLWTTTASLSKKQRSRIRTNPWIGTTSTNNRSSAFIESANPYHQQISPSNQPEYGIYDSTYHTSSFGLIHSESFPQTISNGNIHSINLPPPPPPVPAPTSSVILHQSDSGHGFSLSSSRVINSSSSSSSSASSSPPSSSSSRHNTSGDGVPSNDKQCYRQKKLTKKIFSTSPPSSLKQNPKHNNHREPYFYPNTIASDSGSLTRRKKAQQASSPVTLQYRYQRPSSLFQSNAPMKSSNNRNHPKHYQSHSSSSRSIDDHFSLEFEEILENERPYQPGKDKSSIRKSLSPGKSPFILPLEETNIKLSSPPPLIFSPTLTKTNSRAILKHIEEIENEIRLIKNLDLANGRNNDDEEEVVEEDDYILSPHAYPEEDSDLEDENIVTNDLENEQENKDGRKSIYEQVDQWVDKCLNPITNITNPSTLLHTECDRLSNTIKDYVVCVCSNDEQQTAYVPTPVKRPQTMELLTAFYISSTLTPVIRRTSSLTDESFKLENNPTTAAATTTNHQKSIQECPF